MSNDILTQCKKMSDLIKCNNCNRIFEGYTDDACSRCGSDDVEEIELRQDVVDFVQGGQIPDDYTEDDYEYDSDIINNMYDVIVNGR